MKIKQIKKLIQAKFDDWTDSIESDSVRKMAKAGSIITGGCIASMLLREEVNDFDVYFKDLETTKALAEYYLGRFQPKSGDLELRLDVEGDRVRVVTHKSGNDKELSSFDRGITASESQTLNDPGQIADVYQETETKALATDNEDGKPKYRPVFVTTNAITLANKVQLVLRFHGPPDKIHENYDFVHCTNYWTSWDGELVLRQAALESILSKELRYVGSKYPVCSVIRLRKFIQRQWTVNAGQILKMIMQINDLDLKNISVLQDQLTGVDSAYFCEVICKLHDKDPEKVNSAYLCEIIDRIF